MVILLPRNNVRFSVLDVSNLLIIKFSNIPLAWLSFSEEIKLSCFSLIFYLVLLLSEEEWFLQVQTTELHELLNFWTCPPNFPHLPPSRCVALCFCSSPGSSLSLLFQKQEQVPSLLMCPFNLQNRSAQFLPLNTSSWPSCPFSPYAN